MASWQKNDDNDPGEITVSGLRMMTEEQQQSILFKAIRGQSEATHYEISIANSLCGVAFLACDLHVIRSVLQVNRTLLNAKMFGYEGTDVFEVIKNVRVPPCSPIWWCA